VGDARSSGTGGRAKPIMPITRHVLGDRIGGVEDPYGQKWTAGDPQGGRCAARDGEAGQAFYAQMAARANAGSRARHPRARHA